MANKATASTGMEKLLAKLRSDYPRLTFTKGESFSWSPKTRTVTYSLNAEQRPDIPPEWSLLHELAHALLGHRNYQTDFELVLLEVAAWCKAEKLAQDYDVQIDDDHVQDCIDTYRDWLYQRSACPTCGNTSLQENSVTYRCFNCSTAWTVTASRFCRPYRLTNKQQKTPSAAPESVGTTFLQEL